MPFEYFIGGRYLRTRQKHAFISLITFLSIAGVAVGVMALIVVIAVMAGFESDLKTRILGIESHIVLTRQEGNFFDYRRVLRLIKDNEQVVASSPFISSQVMLKSQTNVSGAVLRGVDPASVGSVVKHFRDSSLRDKFQAAKISAEELAIPGIVLGKELAGSLRVIKGDTVYIVSPRGMLTPVGHIPSMKRFRVTGLFESGMYEYDGAYAYIGLQEAQKILRINDTVSGIEIKVKDIYKAEKTAEKLVESLGFPYQAKDWTKMNRNLFSALKLEKTVMFIILTLIILVAAFNIASSLIMMVMKKTRDIGILKAMGAPNTSIRKIFIFSGMAIGTVGTSLGVLLGLGLCILLRRYKFIELPGDVYYITTLPVRLEALDVFMIGLAAIVICFLATLYPAHKASGIDPVEAIRYG
ncbi:MAG: lipoprotein-releasing ABC transporter permease subunit [Deltaproteobacteria bacterium]|nr:lipoprotein-releasing ABC transporter permease subunit [Deltaproteobacteria bacterium]MBW2218225.1 lipoprotein-releasing ABC transporter permease subunit [Deltaproteobacteria bacterium]